MFNLLSIATVNLLLLPFDDAFAPFFLGEIWSKLKQSLLYVLGIFEATGLILREVAAQVLLKISIGVCISEESIHRTCLHV
jgi:hypothetical protein